MRNLKKIGIFCEQGVSDEEILSHLLEAKGLNPVCFFSPEELIEDYQGGNTQGVVFGLESLSEKRIELLQNISLRLEKTPLAVLSPEVSYEGRLAISQLNSAFVLHYPTEMKDLSGVLNKAFTEINVVAARREKRYPVHFNVQVKGDNSEGHCLLTDLSQGGAGGIVTDSYLQRGETVQLLMPILQGVKSHWISAKVMWERVVNEAGSPRQKIGVQFAS